MSASSAERRLSPTIFGLLWLLAGLLAAPSACLAAADQGAPTPLIPTPLLPTGPGAPIQSSPQPLSPLQQVPAPSAAPLREIPQESAGPRGDRIEVHDLSAPDGSAVGVLDEAHGGFGSDMWAGASLGIVQKVMPLLPGASPWRSVQRLQRKLLLSAAAVPAGKSVGESLIKLRADKLWAMGDAEGLAALLKGVPDQLMTPDLRHMEIDAALIAGEIPTACQQGTVLRQRAPDDIFTAKLQIFCQFNAGKANEAGLGVDLLREQKIQDAAFFAAADALAGIAPGKLDSFANPSPLTLAMARAAKLALPESIVTASLSAPLLRAVATNPTATLEARLSSGERAEVLGALDTEFLRQLFEQVTFTPQELNGPVNAAGTDKGIRSRALLFRAAQQQTQAVAKMEIIAKALSLAGDGQAYFAAARLYAPQITALRPSPELASFAPAAVRSLLAAGRPDAVAPWVALARSSGESSAASVTAGLWPILRLAGEEHGPAIPQTILAAWRKGRADLPPAMAERRILIGYGLLAALGDKVPADDWLALYDGPQIASAAVAPPPRHALLWHGLRTAAEDLRLGESVLFSLALLGDGGFTQTDPTDLYRAVATLRLIGLDSDARALAVEAAIANGV
ncbi:antifreeze protein [Telmatospirillum sp.]|uniref:antifreeze protein n=1 Tax=Telmatospirillum sp. TaxID=2079197 RepID=UPI00283FAE96|nr:antifreeze protein [Telmatospirillum sp.]MDR3437016.1 antifreeze protein [Telmatospirillum sp.]